MIRTKQIVLAGLSVCACLAACAWPLSAAQTPRVGLALVIGNASYAQEELPTVRTDRAMMARALRSQGFAVREVEDLAKRADFEEAFRNFLEAEDAQSDDVLLIYYSGHGVQIEGKAYLVGTAAKASTEGANSLRDVSLGVDDLIRQMEIAVPKARVLIVDACRNNAFGSAPRRAGTAFQRATTDTYVIFADEPGRTIPSRSGDSLQSPFTAGLLFALENSDSGIENRFELARNKTRELNPDQNPQLLKSDEGSDRAVPFIHRAGRAPSSGASARLLNEAADLYALRQWTGFRDKIREARILGDDPALLSRLDRELKFVDAVVDASNAEREAPPRWDVAATEWTSAGDLFPVRAWTMEKAALAWLMADNPRNAARALSAALSSGTRSEQASQLVQGLRALESSIALDEMPVRSATGIPEFEKAPAVTER